MGNVFVVGSMNIDLIFNTKRIPESGETMQSDSFHMLSGGKGANQAVACSLLGTSSYMIGNVGNDLFGEQVIKSLEDSSVNVDYILKNENKSTGVACIILNQGDNRIILDQGANSETSYIQVSTILHYLANKNDVLLAQLEVPVDTILKSFAAAKQKGLKTILNPAPAQDLPEEIYNDVDIIIPNEIEAEMITGISSKSEYFDQDVINFFLTRGVKEVIITKGCKGSVYGSVNDLFYTGAYDVDVVDTTGAGDAFVGAIACEVAMGKTVKDSLKFATASSALAVSRFGAQNSMPNRYEVEDFLKGK